MADLISRDAAIEAMRECLRRVYQFAKPFEVNRIMDCIKAVKELPTIDAIPVEWLRKYTAVGTTPLEDRLTEGNERIIIHRILNDWQKEQEAR